MWRVIPTPLCAFRKGVSLKNVSKMLSHASVKMTEHYARVLDTSILRDE